MFQVTYTFFLNVTRILINAYALHNQIIKKWFRKQIFFNGISNGSIKIGNRKIMLVLNSRKSINKCYGNQLFLTLIKHNHYRIYKVVLTLEIASSIFVHIQDNNSLHFVKMHFKFITFFLVLIFTFGIMATPVPDQGKYFNSNSFFCW